MLPKGTTLFSKCEAITHILDRVPLRGAAFHRVREVEKSMTTSVQIGNRQIGEGHPCRTKLNFVPNLNLL